MLECETILEEMHIRVRDFYRGIFDKRNAPRGTFIASGDDCEIEDKVIEWAGLTDQWEESGLGQRHSFWEEVLWPCSNLINKTREWEGGGPGLSGVWYNVRTMDAKQLREEIAEWFQILVERDKKAQEKTRRLSKVKKAPAEPDRPAPPEHAGEEPKPPGSAADR